MELVVLIALVLSYLLIRTLVLFVVRTRKIARTPPR